VRIKGKIAILREPPAEPRLGGSAVHYVVDQANRIVDVDGDWDVSAAEHTESAVAPTGAKIIGQPLEAFMAGDTTKMFVRSALDAARLLGETRRLPYRCDSPSERRRFEMVISPLAAGHVKVAHVLVEAMPRVARPAIALPAVGAGWRCSQCLLVRLVGSHEWNDPGLDLSAPLADDVCPPCSRRLFASDHPDRLAFGD
jgi:hypothetical protein